METGLLKKTYKNRITFRNKKLSTTSKLAYRTGVRQFLAFIESMGYDESPDAVKAWLEAIEKEMSPASFNLRLQAVKEYLSEKYKTDLRSMFLIQETFKRFKRATVSNTVLSDDFLTIEQVKDLSQKFTTIISMIFRAMFWTGCRISELLNVRLADIKVSDKVQIRIRYGKGKKERTVFLPKKLYKEIRSGFRIKDQVYLFETRNGKKYHRSYICKEFHRQGKKFGFKIHPHMCRHAKACFLRDVMKLTPDQIAKALGNTVQVCLKYYFHGTPSASDQGIGEYDF
jgi:integrase